MGNDPTPSISPISASVVADRFTRLREKVLAKRPVLRGILEKKGEKMLLDYANEYVDINMNPPILERQNEFLETMNEMTSERFGPEVGESVVRQLEKYYFASTADHTGPITHPFFVNSNLLTAASFLSHSDPVLQNVIVLSCANITSNNSSFPRGLLFHGLGKDGPEMHRLAMLSANSRAPIYHTAPYGKEAIEKIHKTLDQEVRDGKLDSALRDRVRDLYDSIYAKDDILACSSYSEQVAKTNMHLWSKFFEAGNIKLPRLVYLEQEELTVRLIEKYHLHQDTIINHVLFDPDYEPFINNYFDGIFGSFSSKDHAGTYLFWAEPEGSGPMRQMVKEGNYIVTEDGTLRVELSPEPLLAAMKSKKIIPCLLVNFMVISFYYGLKCLGGFNQVNYLTLMKNSYIKMNVDLENYRSIEVCARAQTKEICDGLSVAYLGYNSHKMILATGVDLILYGQADSWERLMQVCKHITLDEAISPLMPEIYRISYDQTEQEQDLLEVTEKDINLMMGLDQKIQPCVRIG